MQEATLNQNYIDVTFLATQFISGLIPTVR